MKPFDDLDAPAGGHTQCTAQTIDVGQNDALARDRRTQRRGADSRIAGRRCDGRQWVAVSLRDIEDVGGAKSREVLRIVVSGAFSSADDNRREDRDALLALANEPIERAPGVESRDARGRRALTGDQADVVEAVAVEPSHRLQEGGELVALPGIEQRGEAVERIGRELLEIVGIHVVSSVRTAVRGSFTTKGTRQSVRRTQRATSQRGGRPAGRDSVLGWREAKRPATAAYRWRRPGDLFMTTHRP